MASVESPPDSSPSLTTPAVDGLQPESSLSRERLADLLARIQAGESEPGHDSLATGCSSRVILLRHADSFLRYRSWIRPGLVLDWGCRHAPDSCLLRATETAGERELHGCDVGENRYERALEYSRLAFRALDHPYRLPYADGMFDTVLGSGVLEHVPDDGESLKELYRILEPGGRLIITFLPNSRSNSFLEPSRQPTPTDTRSYDRTCENCWGSGTVWATIEVDVYEDTLALSGTAAWQAGYDAARERSTGYVDELAACSYCGGAGYRDW